MRVRSTAVIVPGLLFVACSQIVGADFQGYSPAPTPLGGSSGMAGSVAASGGAASGGSAGAVAGSTAVVGGAAGTAGAGGSPSAGNAGAAGSSAGGTSCPPGTAGSSESGIVINEIKGQGDGDDYIEIFNRSSLPIDVGGYYVGDDSGNVVTVTPGTLICARSYVLMMLQQPTASGPTNCLGFSPCFTGTWGVAAEGEALFLYDAGGELLDDVVYPDESGPQGVDDGQAFGCLTDGDEPLGPITLSPGQPNAAAN